MAARGPPGNVLNKSRQAHRERQGDDRVGPSGQGKTFPSPLSLWPLQTGQIMSCPELAHIREPAAVEEGRGDGVADLVGRVEPVPDLLHHVVHRVNVPDDNEHDKGVTWLSWWMSMGHHNGELGHH
jgi:hypothetical protein